MLRGRREEVDGRPLACGKVGLVAGGRKDNIFGGEMGNWVIPGGDGVCGWEASRAVKAAGMFEEIEIAAGRWGFLVRQWLLCRRIL